MGQVGSDQDILKIQESVHTEGTSRLEPVRSIQNTQERLVVNYNEEK